ncbi:MAG: MBL fold metallo-hydrolase [Eubacteriales bacterium]|nr:MBL fold metallo-hydrolase [Lachnospiraceae bacterium]MDO4416712.1 MBL fold metallo-hydrolase [Eubacteriales bacterium]
MRLRVLGTRGSMALSLKNRSVFGGSTSCYMVTAGRETVFLDAGTGLLTAPVDFPAPPHILLTHLHLDHLLGLGMYPRLSKAGEETVIHVPVGPGEIPAVAMDRLYSPPFWPVRLQACGGDVRFLPLSFPLHLGSLTIEGVPGNHPGGSWIMKLCFQGKSIVYATDYEYEPDSFARLVRLAQDADLILYDGQYAAEELEKHRGFGHSTPDYGLRLLEESRAGQLWVIHHDPGRTDEDLLVREAEWKGKGIHFAREGEEITL